MDTSSSLIRTSALSARHLPRPGLAVLVPLRSALIFVLFFMVGLLIYPFLSPLLDTCRCLPAERFCGGIFTPVSSLSDLPGILSRMLAREWILFGLSFLATFSFFCGTLTALLVFFDALSLGLSVGYLDACMRAGACPPAVFTGFLLFEGIVSAFFLLYTCRCAFLSARLRRAERGRPFLSLRLSVGHLGRTLFNLLILCALGTVFVFIL